MSDARGEARQGFSTWVATTFDGGGERTVARRAVRVLLVDDSSDDRVRFGRALSGAGYEVHAAEDGSQAWARLQEQRFDVLVSDRQMPGTDGLELVRRVRASREHARIPVIMVSGMDAPSDRAAGLAAGAAEYICKTNERATPVLLDSVERLTRSVGGAVPAHPLFARALVVDGSSVARQLLSRTLQAYCGAMAAVPGLNEARLRVDEGGVSLILLDTAVEGALAWLEESAAWVDRPAFLIVTSCPSHAEETRVSLLGAIGYLAKPISVRELSQALVSANEAFTPAPPRAHVFPLVEASIADPTSGEPQLSCPIVNLSAGGAMLSTVGPIALGTRLFLRLTLGGQRLTTHARVVRIQEPGWGVAGGCGVVFEYDSDECRRAVERFVDAQSARAYPRRAVSRTADD